MLSNDWEQVRRVLIIRLDNIGDVIMTGPALRSVKTALPDAHLTLLASPAGSQAAPMLPWIDEVLIWRALWQEISLSSGVNPQHELDLVNLLRSGEYDAAIILTSFSQSPYPPAYACTLAGIPLRLGQSKEFGGGVLTHWIKPLADATHQVDRNLGLVQSVGFPDAGADLELRLPDETRVKARKLLAASGVDHDHPYIVLAPGASCSARRYPSERFARLVSILVEQTDYRVVVVGSQRETVLFEPFRDLSSKMVSLIGQTSVPEMAALIAESRLVIANDSAPLHLADALDRPMLILFSGTELESQWEPRKAPARLLRRETECHPCYRFQCPYEMECLDIPAEEAAEEALALLKQTSMAGVVDSRAVEGVNR